MRYLPLALILAACESSVPPATIAQVPFAADSGDIAIRCGILIDGLNDEAVADRLVVIRNGRFERIRSGDASVTAGIPILNLDEYTCLPGLINAHVHLVELPEDASDYGVFYRRTTEDNNNLALRTAKLSLLTGFTTVRNIGDFFPNSILYARDQIRAGLAAGPRIQTAGPFLTIPAGGGDLVVPQYDESEIPASGRTGVAKGIDQFREKAELAVAEGADLLKVIASGAVFSYGISPGSPEMTEEEIAVVVDVARDAGIKVSAHVHSAQSGKEAIRAGVDFLEHASLLDDEAIAMAASRYRWMSTTAPTPKK